MIFFTMNPNLKYFFGGRGGGKGGGLGKVNYFSKNPNHTNFFFFLGGGGGGAVVGGR